VTSDEIENIAAAVAALAIRENMRTVFARRQRDVLDETACPVPDRSRPRRVPDWRHAARRRGAWVTGGGSVHREENRLVIAADETGRAVGCAPEDRSPPHDADGGAA